MRGNACLVLVVVLAIATAGCLGSAVGPHVPADALRKEGWSAAGSPSTTEKAGLVQIVQQNYGPGGSDAFGGLLLVSVTNIPLVDEARFLPAEIDAYAKAEGLDLRPSGTETVRLTNLGDRSVTAEVYDVRGAPVPAKAAIFHFTCDAPDAFVAVVAYGALPAAGGVLKPAGADVYAQAKRLGTSTACGA